MIGVQIQGKRLRALRRTKRLSGAGLGAQTGRTVSQIYRVETGASATSLEFLDSLVPLFGIDAVADLIIDAEDRETFLGAHQVPA